MSAGRLPRLGWERPFSSYARRRRLGRLASPYYLSFDQITYSLQQSIAVGGLVALGLMVIIVVGEIDISLPAIMALGNIVLAQLAILGVPSWWPSRP